MKDIRDAEPTPYFTVRAKSSCDHGTFWAQVRLGFPLGAQ